MWMPEMHPPSPIQLPNLFQRIRWEDGTFSIIGANGIKHPIPTFLHYSPRDNQAFVEFIPDLCQILHLTIDTIYIGSCGCCGCSGC